MITENDLIFMAAFGALIATLLLMTAVYMMVARRMERPGKTAGQVTEAWTRSARRFCFSGIACLVSTVAIGLGFVSTYGHASVPLWTMATAVVWVVFAGITGHGISLLTAHAALTGQSDEALSKTQDLTAAAE